MRASTAAAGSAGLTHIGRPTVSFPRKSGSATIIVGYEACHYGSRSSASMVATGSFPRLNLLRRMMCRPRGCSRLLPRPCYHLEYGYWTSVQKHPGGFSEKCRSSERPSSRVQNTATSDLNEARTRALLINPQLEKSGWNLSDHSQIQVEVPVKGYDPTPWNGFTDFCLYHPQLCKCDCGAALADLPPVVGFPRFPGANEPCPDHPFPGRSDMQSPHPVS